MNKGKQVRCQCCGYLTLKSPGVLELCPVCWWEDDGQDDSDVDSVRGTVNGFISLSEARTNYLRYGASHPNYVPYVRSPLNTEA
jgi:hypothetical protein